LEAELIRHGALLGGVHIDILRNSLPIIRADYRGLETYTWGGGGGGGAGGEEGVSSLILSEVSGEEPEQNPPPVSSSGFSGPVTVWGGSDDLHNVSEESLQGWSAHADADQPFSFKLFAGSHFYFTEKETKPEFLEELTKICLACL
jgi:hypothetical protein